MRRLVVVLVSVLGLLATAFPGLALPDENPDETWMVNGDVRSVVRVGQTIWLGGKFTQLRSDPTGGTVISVSGIAAVDAVTGRPVSGLHLPKIGGVSAPIVYDMSYDGVGSLYFSGTFRSVDGTSRSHVASLNPATGKLLAFRAGAVSNRSVLGTPAAVYVGSQKLVSYTPSGASTPGWRAPSVSVKAGAPNGPSIRDIESLPDGNLVISGSFDFVNGQAHKMAAKVHPITGAVDSRWEFRDFLGDSAYGIDLVVDAGADAIYAAVGGSDFVARYRASDGDLIWKTDTSGSAQYAVPWSDGTHVIVGGHFQWIAFRPGQQCGSNSNPSGQCKKQLRLAAVNAKTGVLNTAWTPEVAPFYNGVWSMVVDGNRLHLGGDFKRVESRTQWYYGRLSEPR